MDPMEDVQMNGQSNSPYPNQCRQPQMPSASPSFPPPSRDGQRYDPVHDSEAWIRNNSRPLYPPAQNIPHWQPSSYMPVPHWQTYGEPQRSNPHVGDSPGFRASRGYMDLPWSEMRSFDSSPFAYNQYAGPFGSSVASEPSNGPNNSQTTTPSMPSQFPSYNLHPGHPDIWHRAESQYGRPPPLTPLPQRRNAEASIERAARHHQPTPPSERVSESHRYAASVARRAYRARGLPDSWAASPRRLAVQGSMEGQSDEDDEEAVEAAEYRRSTEFILQSESDDRQIAAMRAALASGKKVASKDYIKSLEHVPLDQIPENERNCSICYETIGTENPEGLTEKAVRLLKCRHIFGDICIKKWCQDSDTCPYCRDKLPSEMSVKKTVISEYSRAAQRERMRLVNRRHAFASDSPSGYEAGSLGSLFNDVGQLNRTYEPAPAQRARDDYLRARATRGFSDDLETFPLADTYLAEPWGSSSQSNRPSAVENSDRPSERRRANRGRLGNGRPPHLQGRPTSVGSARFITSAANHQNNLQRAQVSNNIPPSISGFGGHAPPRRSITPGLTRQDSTSESSGARNLAAQELLSALEAESRAEEASPPVAVGTAEGNSRHSWDLFTATAPRSGEWDTFGSPPRPSPLDTVTSTLGSPFQETVRSPLRQHLTSDSSAHPEGENFASGPLFGDSSNRLAGPRWSR